MTLELIKCSASRVIILAGPKDTMTSVVFDRDDELRPAVRHQRAPLLEALEMERIETAFSAERVIEDSADREA